MSSTIPEILSTKIVSSTEIKITWSISSSPDIGVDGYNIYRGISFPVLIGTVNGRLNTIFIDSSLSYDNTYTYSVSSFDYDGNESSLSDQVSKELSEAKFIIEQLSDYLERNGAQNLTLVTQQTEVPVLEAMEGNIDDVILAIDNPVHFDTQYRENLEDNQSCFWYIPMDDLWNYTVGLPYSDNVTKNRRFIGDVKITNKLSNVFRRLYQDANYFFS